jgi:hypothetical protein
MLPGVRRSAALLALLLLVAACGSPTTANLSDTEKKAAAAAPPADGGLPWNAPADPLAATAAAGLQAETHETLTHHVHAHLDVFVNGKQVVVPAGVGIDTANPAVNKGQSPDGSPAWGGIKECSGPCISPLHTHDDTGVLHTESASAVPNRLGQFFVEWGVKLDAGCVGGYCRPAASVVIFVDGNRFDGDPTAIELTDHKEIAIVIGSPPSSVPGAFPGG